MSEHNIQVKPSTVNKHLVSGAMVRDGCPGFTFKRLCVHHEERYSERVKEARVAYLRSYLHYKEMGTVFVLLMRHILGQQALGAMVGHPQEKGPSAGRG